MKNNNQGKKTNVTLIIVLSIVSFVLVIGFVFAVILSNLYSLSAQKTLPTYYSADSDYQSDSAAADDDYNNNVDSVDDGNDVNIDDMSDEEIINYCVDNAVDNIVDLYGDLNLESPAECLSVYCKLLSNGYLSKGGKYAYTDAEYEEYDFNLAYSVLKGEALCRNEDDLFTKTLKNYGFDCYCTTCYSDSDYKSPKSAKEPNHQVTFVYDSDNENVYFLDPTNNVFVDNFSKSSVYSNGDDGCYTYPLPEYSDEDGEYLTSYNSKSEINRMKKLIKDDKISVSKSYYENESLSAMRKFNADSGKSALKNFNSEMQTEVFEYID